MTRIDINGAYATIREREVLTAGRVGAQVKFIFDQQWDNLAKTAVFQQGEVTKDVVLTEATTVIPWEVLQIVGVPVSIGVFGSNADGSVMIPTAWVETDPVKSGADPSGDESADPTPPIWAQIIASGCISKAQVNENGELEVTYLNGETVNVGNVVGKDGTTITDISVDTIRDIDASLPGYRNFMEMQISTKNPDGTATVEIFRIPLPHKGTDYFTNEDKAGMVNDVLAALPTWDGGIY